MTHTIVLFSKDEKIIQSLKQIGFSELINTIDLNSFNTLQKPLSSITVVIDNDIYNKSFEKNILFEKHIIIVENESEIETIIDFNYDDYISIASPISILEKRIKLYLQKRNVRDNKYLQLLEQLGDSVVLLDTDGFIFETNSRFCEISNYAHKELLKQNISKIFQASEFDIFLNSLTEKTALFEAVLTTKNKILKPYEIRVSYIEFDEQPFYLVIARDIQERLKSLKKLEESEERFRKVINHSPNGMIIFKEDTISYINLTGIQLLDGTYEDFIDQPFSKLVPPAHRKELARVLREAENGNTTETRDITFIKNNNREMWVSLNCIPIDVHGELNKFVIFQDLTKQKQTLYDLENKDYRLREIQKIAKLGHWENNLIKNNLYWSDEIYKIFGAVPQSFEITNEIYLDYIHPDDRDSVQEAYKNNLRTREPYEIVFRIILEDGTVKYLNQKCSTMFDKAGKPVRSLGTVMDISHTIKTEKALKQTEEKFQLLFENLDQPFLICKPKTNDKGEAYDYIINDVNPASEKLFHGDFYELKDRSILDLFSDPDFWIEKYNYVLETSETIVFRKYSRDLHKHLDVVLYPVMGKKQIAGIYSDVTQKVYAENQLQQLTARLQKVQQYAQIGFFDVHVVTGRSKWSSVMLQIFEYDKNVKQSFETFMEQIHPDDSNRVRRTFRNSIKQREINVSLEFRLLLNRGKIKHIYTEFSNTFEGKTCLKTEGWIQDISDLRTAISAMRESEEKLRMVTSGTKLGLWEWDLENKEFSLDDIGSAMLGYSPEEIWGDESIYLGLIHKDDNANLEKSLDKFWKRSSQLFSTEYRIKMKHGRYKWVSCIGVASDYTADGVPTKMIGFNQDISSRKKVESDLRDSENKFRRIFEIENDSLFLVDIKTGIILETNDAASVLTEYSREDLLEQDFFSLSAQPNQMRTYVNLKRTRVNDDSVIKKSGETCKVEMSLAYFTWKSKMVILAAVRDVSERHRFEQELVDAKEKAEESDSLKSAFLANMSHEIRTPLNAIVGFSRLLARKNYEEEKRKLFIQDIQANSNQLLTIINDILDISKIESGQFILNPEPVCLNQLCQEVHDSMQVQIKNKDLTLFCEKPLSDAEVTVNMDEVRLKQVLGNLLNNAIKFTEKGYIHFGYKQTNSGELTFFVKDTGIGIAAEKQNIIFEHFRQEDDTTTRKYGGTGLGLSISQSLIELMGGTIWVESKKGEGAHFFVKIPYKTIIEDQNSNKNNLEDALFRPEFNGEQILVCDDHTSSFVFISEMFEDQNVKVLQAKSGNEAVNICNDNPSISLVLMDIQMSGLNGVDAMLQIKKLQAHIPVVAQTAFAQKGDRERFMKEGFDEYITKPLDDRDLQSIFKRFLKRS